jgi:hypothetical protein
LRGKKHTSSAQQLTHSSNHTITVIIRYIDNWSVMVIGLTLILFVLALFITGSTHEFLLETGIFLVSVKLILMSYKTGAQGEQLKDQLSQIQAAIQRLERSSPPK